MSSPAPSARAHLLQALHADLVGPYSLEPSSEEVLWLPPSRWYLTGFLAPEGERDPGDAEVAAVPTARGSLGAGQEADESPQRERAVKRHPVSRSKATPSLTHPGSPGSTPDAPNRLEIGAGSASALSIQDPHSCHSQEQDQPREATRPQRRNVLAGATQLHVVEEARAATELGRADRQIC